MSLAMPVSCVTNPALSAGGVACSLLLPGVMAVEEWERPGAWSSATSRRHVFPVMGLEWAGPVRMGFAPVLPIPPFWVSFPISFPVACSGVTVALSWPSLLWRNSAFRSVSCCSTSACPHLSCFWLANPASVWTAWCLRVLGGGSGVFGSQPVLETEGQLSGG